MTNKIPQLVSPRQQIKWKAIGDLLNSPAFFRKRNPVDSFDKNFVLTGSLVSNALVRNDMFTTKTVLLHGTSQLQ